MTVKTGECGECGGAELAVDPDADKVLYEIFGAWLREHKPGCSRYPRTTAVALDEL